MLQCVTFAKINKTNGYLRFTYMTMKRILPSGLMIAASVTCMAQSLEKMQWFNEPEQWGIENDTLSMEVTPQTDYWRISHYGFTVDDAPFLYTLRGGEFEVKVKISGDYKTRFDQSGLMLRIDQENYIKAGIEFVDGKYNLSTVVTHHTSDWSIIPLESPVPSVWIKAVRRLDAVEVFYSFDDKEYTMMRNAWLQDNHPVMVGIMGASPDGNGFTPGLKIFQSSICPICAEPSG